MTDTRSTPPTAELPDAARACQALATRFAQTAHDLRTPLNAILGFVQVLQLEGSLSDDQLDSLSEIDRAARLLNSRLETSFSAMREELEAIASLSQAPAPQNPSA